MYVADDQSRITPMVVVPTCAPEWISRCLDSGAQAIIVPHVNTVEQAKMCVNASKFPPMVCLLLQTAVCRQRE